MNKPPATGKVDNTTTEFQNESPIDEVYKEIIGSHEKEASEKAPIEDSSPLMYGDDHIAAQDNPKNEKSVCKCCPYTFSEIERDAIQYVVFDEIFRNLLEMLATVKGWKTKKTKRFLLIYLDHLTMQLGKDTVTIYSSEPGDLKWIGEWVRQNLTGLYENIESLVNEVVSPKLISRDEVAIDVIDSGMINALESVIGKYKGKFGYVQFKAPNPVIPPLKIYRKEEGRLRIEFDCRNDFQITSVIHIKNDLYWCLENVNEQPGLFIDFLYQYYPKEFTSDIKSLFNKIESELEELKALVISQPLEIKRTVKGKNYDLGLNEQVNDIAEQVASSNGSIDIMLEIISKELKISQDSVRIFLGAFQLWAKTIFNRRVIFEEISGLFKSQELHGLSDKKKIKACVKELIGVGLLKDDPTMDVSFSPYGTTLARKLLATKEGL